MAVGLYGSTQWQGVRETNLQAWRLTMCLVMPSFSLLPQQLDKARCGILIGSAFGGMQTFATAVEALETQSEYGWVHRVSSGCDQVGQSMP